MGVDVSKVSKPIFGSLFRGPYQNGRNGSFMVRNGSLMVRPSASIRLLHSIFLCKDN